MLEFAQNQPRNDTIKTKGVNIENEVPTTEQPRSRWHKYRKPLLFGGIILIVLIFIAAGLIIHDIRENQRLDATSVKLKSSELLVAPYGTETRVSDFIEHLEGSIVEDKTIPTDTLGQQEVTFEYINIKNRRRTAHFTIEIIDVTPPTILGQSAYTVTTGYTGELTDLMLSGDNLDDHPVRQIIGEYDLSQPGSYQLTYLITDASGNQANRAFTLNVIAPTPNNSNHTSAPSTVSGTPIREIISQHKTADTKIGIDVSSWQGEIDWNRVKQSGVEFAFIRVGYGYEDTNKLDERFRANIAGAAAAGLPMGVYFYSYAQNTTEAKQQAEWVYEQIRDFPVELGVAFDWEGWQDFNNYGISFHTLGQIASTFLDTLANHGYKSSLYGSKYYLEHIWSPTNYPVWLAQYYDYATYSGDYWLWQLTDNGQVDGINGLVDLDIMYIL